MSGVQSIQKQVSLSIGALSLPIFIELFLQMLLGNVDQFMMSQYSQPSVAAVANANQVINILLYLLAVMSTATTILIAQYMGAKKPDKIEEVYTMSVVVNGLFSVVATACIIGFHRQICLWLGVPPEILHDTELYLNIVSLGIPVTALYYTYVAVFRGHSMPKVSMWVILAVNIVHIILNYVLIYGLGPIPSLGVLGVSLSTLVSRILGLVMIMMAFRKILTLRMKASYLKPFPWQTVKQLLHISVPSGGETLSYNLAQAVIMALINTMGLIVINTKAYVYIIAAFCYMYTVALANAAQIVVGFLLGAERDDEVSGRVWKTTAIGVGISVGLSVLFYVFCEPVMALVTTDPEVVSLAKSVLLVEIFLELGRAVNIVMVQCLQAAGDIQIPMFVGVFGMWVFAVTLSYVFGIWMGWGLVGVWIAMAIDEAVRALIFVYRWYTGKWKGKSLIAV